MGPFMLLKGTFRAFSTFVFGEIDALPPCVDAVRLDLPRTETADEDPEMALLMGVHLVQASQKLQDHSSLYVYEHKQSLRLMPRTEQASRLLHSLSRNSQRIRINVRAWSVSPLHAQ